MTPTNTWIRRLPPQAAPAGASPGGSSLGPKERWVFLLVLACIVIWGLTGSWEYPTLEPASPPANSLLPPSIASAGNGSALFEANGCYACHALDGSEKLGPSLLGIFGESVEFSDGTTALIDDAYLIESILYPQAKLVRGYDDVAMPDYTDLLTEEDAVELVEYIKSLN